MKRTVSALALFFVAALAFPAATFKLFQQGKALPGAVIGDTYYTSSSGGTITRLPIGSNGQCYLVASGLPSWGTCAAGGGPGTGTAGKVPYWLTTTTLGSTNIGYDITTTNRVGIGTTSAVLATAGPIFNITDTGNAPQMSITASTTGANNGAQIQFDTTGQSWNLGTGFASGATSYVLRDGTNTANKLEVIPSTGLVQRWNGITTGATLGTAVASANSVTATGNFFHMTGTTLVQTITAPAAMTQTGSAGAISIVADGLYTTNTLGNIAIAYTPVVNKVDRLVWDNATAKWYPANAAAAGGGGGNVTTTGTEATRPTAGATNGASGDVYFPSDNQVVERSTGSAWVPFGPLYPLSAPPTGSFAWRNQGTATVSTTTGGEKMTAAASGSYDIKGREITAPATPYSIEALFQWVMPPNITLNYSIGLYITDGTQLITYGWPHDGTGIYVFGWTNVTTFNTTYFSDTLIRLRNAMSNSGGLIWLRFRDDGTNRFYDFSSDGETWVNFNSHARTVLFTGATKVGWFVYNKTGGSQNLVVKLVHWKQY